MMTKDLIPVNNKLLQNSRASKFLLLGILTIAFYGCTSLPNSSTAVTSSTTVTNAPAPAIETMPVKDLFDRYMDSEFAPADGFDFPVGDVDGKGGYIDKATGAKHNGWYIAKQFAENDGAGIHPGEDWFGVDGENTVLGQEVFAVANGRVVVAENLGKFWGNVLIIEHIIYENYEKKKVHSLYAHLQEIKIQKGADVQKRQLVATIGQDPERLLKAHLHLEIRLDETLSPAYLPASEGKTSEWMRQHYAAPTEFINSHRKLFVPNQEATVLLVDQDSYKMKLYQKGEMKGEIAVSFGQSKGQKRIQGDNKTPKGMYFIIQKHRGKFAGDYGQYYGGHWIKLNYPNKYDASFGKSKGLITAEQEAKISANWQRRAPTLENTRLGGGIGFHGWIQEWDNQGPRHLSWGCVVMHIYDISRLYDQMPEGTMVVIF
jgi:murein DD-endopeptidase MepM/ murein hydrolase activator NlpD